MLGGWLFESCGYRAPFLIPTFAMLLMLAPIGVSAITNQHNSSHERAGATHVDQLAFVRRPPVLALLFLVVVAIIPLSLVEPSMEPHLSAAPYFLTPRQVGTIFGVIAIMQIVGAMFTTPLMRLTGPFALLYAAPCTMVLAIAIMVAGPERLGLLLPTLSIQSVCIYPIFIVINQLMLRLCRTFDLDPKAYSEVIASAVVLVLTAAVAVGGLTGGALLSVIGFKGVWAVAAAVIAPGPLVVYIGFHPTVMGRPMAPPASDEIDAALESRRNGRAKEVDGGAKLKPVAPTSATSCLLCCSR